VDIRCAFHGLLIPSSGNFMRDLSNLMPNWRIDAMQPRPVIGVLLGDAWRSLRIEQHFSWVILNVDCCFGFTAAVVR